MIRVCGFDDTISWRRAFVPQRMKRKRRGTRCTTCRRVSVLCTRQATESVRIRPSTVTQASAEQDDGVADGRAQVDARGGDCFGDGFQPPEPDAEAADGVGIPGAEAFEFGAAQTQCLHRGCLLSQPGAVVFDARGQGILVLCEAAGFVAVTGIAVCQQRRYEDGVKEKVFFHGFRVLRRR